MKLSRSTDIIRQNNQDYINIDTKNRLIAQLIYSSAEDIYDFNIPFGNYVDPEKAKEMKGTYWIRATISDNKKYNEDVQIVVL